jgi:hypothetical protein
MCDGPPNRKMNTHDFALPFASTARNEPSAADARCRPATSDARTAPNESATLDRSSERRSKFITDTSSLRAKFLFSGRRSTVSTCHARLNRLCQPDRREANSTPTDDLILLRNVFKYFPDLNTNAATVVMPAQAGNQKARKDWVPAFTGRTHKCEMLSDRLRLSPATER